jgi:predicted AAA+ superfamily ATPase
LNVTETGKALGHTRATVEKYLTILERLYLVRRLPAWHKNSAKRLVKAPKVHICDSGVAAALSETTADMWMQDRDRFGHLLESFVVQQLSIQASWMASKVRLWHYRDKDGVEVDCVLTRGNKIWGVEVKAATSIRQSDGKGLRRLADQAGKDFQGGIVLYDGTSVLPIDRALKIYAVPISRLWEL